MIRLVALLCLLALPSWGQEKTIPAYDSIYVNDFASIIDADTEARIVERLTEYRSTTGVELTVLTITSRESYSDLPSIESFAKELFNTWGIGDAERNDGVLLLVARDDREMRIQLGAAYGPVYDGRMQRVIDSIILPEFREDKYAIGIENGVDGIIERLNAEWIDEEPASWSIDNLIPYIMFSIFGLTFGWAIFKNRISDTVAGMRRCPTCGQRTLSRSREVLKKASTIESGSQVLHTRCSNCSYFKDDVRIIPKKTTSSSSGGGSFGGGRSSGGGASGRW